VNRRTKLLVCALSLTAAAAGKPQVEAQKILDRHLAWRGGREAFAQLQSVEHHGTISLATFQGPCDIWETRKGSRRIDFDLKIVAGSQVVNPADSWEINASGQVDDLGAGDAIEARRERELTFGVHLVGPWRNRARLLSPEDRDGLTWDVIRFTYDDGDRIDFLIAGDGSLTWIRSLTDAEIIWRKYEDWRMVEGIRYSFHENELHHNPRQNVELSWDSIKVNREMDVMRFVRPTHRIRKARFVNHASSTGWMDFDLHEESHIYLEGKINGHATPMVVDSAAGASAMSMAYAKQLGLQSEGKFVGSGFGGDQEISLISDVTIQLGTLTFPGMRVAVVDLSAIERRFGRELPFILGKDAFVETVVDIDYPRRRIAFHDASRYSYKGPGRRLAAFAEGDGVRMVKATVEDLPPAQFTLDTGNGSSLLLYARYVEANQLLAGRTPLSDRRNTAIGGSYIVTVGTVRSFSFSDLALSNVPTSFFRTGPAGSGTTDRLAGNIGNDILSRFHIVFDYPHDRIFIEPESDWRARPFRKDRTGLFVERHGNHLEVMHVAVGSPAARSGWKIGDLISKINGVSVSGQDSTGQAWRVGAAGTTVVLTDSSGNSRSLVLADYY